MLRISNNIKSRLLKSDSFLKALLVCFVILSIVISHTITYAGKKKKKSRYSPVQTSLVVDAASGKILHARNAKTKIFPASLTKVMTLYLVFESLSSGKLNLSQKLYVSKYATQALPSKLYLKHKEKISVRDAILALSVKSCNDVARVVAENLAGSEKRFARLMTIRARQLGMNNTHFTNASGWHHPKQVTTAVDLAKLSIAIKRDFPQYYHFFNKTSFKFKGKLLRGHNRVTASYKGAEGLKTGFHTPAGCNLITTATRGNKSLVGVVTGRKSGAIRDKKMIQLLDKHFASSNKGQRTQIRSKAVTRVKSTAKNRAKRKAIRNTTSNTRKTNIVIKHQKNNRY